MQNSLFSTALTPIPAARSRRVQSVDRAASRYPRSSTPLRANAVNTSSRTSTQEPVVQNKSSSTGHIAGKPGRKRKLPAVGKGGKVANREVSTAAAVRNDRPTSSADSGHSRVIHSLAGKLQQQKCEAPLVRKRQNRAGSSSSSHKGQVLQHVKVKNKVYRRWKPVTSESIKMVMKALEAAVGDVSCADSLVNSAELKQLHHEIKQELHNLKVPASSVAYSTISAQTESMERGMNEVENDNSCLSADLELVDRYINKTTHKLRSMQKHNSLGLSTLEEE